MISNGWFSQINPIIATISLPLDQYSSKPFLTNKRNKKVKNEDGVVKCREFSHDDIVWKRRKILNSNHIFHFTALQVMCERDTQKWAYNLRDRC